MQKDSHEIIPVHFEAKQVKRGKMKKKQPEQITIHIIMFPEQYPTSEFKGSYFHLRQSFNSKVSQISLQKFFENNADLALALRIPAQNFVPIIWFEPLVDRRDTRSFGGSPIRIRIFTNDQRSYLLFSDSLKKRNTPCSAGII